MLEKILSQDDKTGFAVLFLRRHNRQKFGALLQSIIGNFKSIIGLSRAPGSSLITRQPTHKEWHNPGPAVHLSCERIR